MADFDDLLIKTSRTFAASIPLLEEPTRREVTIAYLLLRIADTFEDAYSWPKEERIEALEDFADLLEKSGAPEQLDHRVEDWLRRAPTTHDGYLELLQETPAVFAELARFTPRAQSVIRLHTARTARGMKEFVARATGRGALELVDLDDLRAYCYVVAGIVGELLTDLFVLAAKPLSAVATELRARAATFGEALQLVNILKDSEDDQVEGRCFLPVSVDRARVFDLARSDLRVAGEYVLLLQEHGGSPGMVAFTALPVRLAWATLDQVESRGPGAKVTRQRVMEMLAEIRDAVLSRRPPLPELSP